MERLQLVPSELGCVTRLVDSITARYDSVVDPAFLAEAPVLAHELPVRIRMFLSRFRREEIGCCVVTGHKIDDEAIGPTPSHWNEIGASSSTLHHEVLLVVYTSLVGDVFGWATQQDGRLVHNVLPIREHANEQLGTGSQTLLTWHTEDAFHPYRGDYIVLACLRNPYAGVTTIGNVDDLDLDPRTLDILFQERFIIRPDESHLAKNNSALGDVTFSAIEALASAPPCVAVLFGSRTQPFVRADPYFMDTLPDDRDAAWALGEFQRQMDARMQDVVLKPGDFCFLDNYKVVHGRKPFKPRYDGTDRWLKRVCVTRDLRKSRDARDSVTSPVIG